MSRAFTQTLFTPYLHLIGVKTVKNGAQKPKTRLSAASIFQKEKSLNPLYNKGFKDSPWTGISSSKIWTATSQALEVGSTPIARSSENTAPSERWCFFVCDIRFSFILSLPVPADTAPTHRQGHQSAKGPHRSASPT